MPKLNGAGTKAAARRYLHRRHNRGATENRRPDARKPHRSYLKNFRGRLKSKLESSSELIARTLNGGEHDYKPTRRTLPPVLSGRRINSDKAGARRAKKRPRADERDPLTHKRVSSLSFRSVRPGQTRRWRAKNTHRAPSTHAPNRARFHFLWLPPGGKVRERPFPAHTGSDLIRPHYVINDKQTRPADEDNGDNSFEIPGEWRETRRASNHLIGGDETDVRRR